MQCGKNRSRTKGIRRGVYPQRGAWCEDRQATHQLLLLLLWPNTSQKETWRTDCLWASCPSWEGRHDSWHLCRPESRERLLLALSCVLLFPPFYSVQNLNPWMMLPTFEAVFLLSSGKSHWKYVHKLTKRHVSLMPSASCKPIKLTTEISHRKEWEIKSNWV